MFQSAAVVTFSVKVGIVFEPVLNGTTYNCLTIDKAVGFCYYQTVVVAGFAAFGGPMVFHGFAHQPYLFLRKMCFYPGKETL